MICIGFIIAVVAFTAHSQTTTSVSPNLHRIGMKTGAVFLASAANAEITDTCTSRYSCYNCTAAWVCTPLADDKGYLEVRRVNCSGNTPYCDYGTGTCSSTLTQECAPQGDFICQRDGYFPDPTTCTKFHYCKNSVSYSFNCIGSYYYYDPMSESCVYNRGCYSFSCSGKSGLKVPYSGAAWLYAYCIGNAPVVVDKCRGRDELNVTSQRCEPVCKKEGLIEDSADCRSYYRCSIASQVSTTVTYSIAHETCPVGQAYSSTSFQCVPIAQVPGCYAQTTTPPTRQTTTTVVP